MADGILDFNDEVDPNRERLGDKFTQGFKGDMGKLGEAAQQTLQMVTPQSFWQKPTLDSALRDLVEYSPYGDLKDAWSAINPNSGLDPVERVLAGFSALPILAFTVGGPSLAAQSMINSRNRRISSLTTSGESLVAAGSGSTMDIEVDPGTSQSMIDSQGQIAFPDKNPTADILAAKGKTVSEARTDASAQVMAQVFMATDPGAVLMSRDSFGELTELVVGMYGERLRPNVSQAAVDWLLPNASEQQRKKKEAKKAAERYDPAGWFDATMKNLGKRLLLAHNARFPLEGVDEKTGETVVFTAEEREFMAAKAALASTFGAIRAGILFEQMPAGLEPSLVVSDMTIDKLVSGLFDEKAAPLAGDFIYQMSKGLLSQRVGPDLSVDVSQTITAIVVGLSKGLADAGAGAVVVMGLNTELNPDTRVWDRETGFILDEKALDDRHNRMSYGSMTGDFVVNIVAQSLQEQTSNPARYEQSLKWYWNAQATVKHLAGVTGKSPMTLAALFSALSPQSQWTPDNLVAGVHVILRYSTPELQPGSIEYQQAFADAVNAGGWAEALWADTGKKVRKLVGDESGIVAWYADPNHFITKAGTNFRGMTRGPQQQSAIELLLMDIEWPLVVRMMKTINFASAIDNPFLQFLVAIDTHQSGVILGSSLFGEAIVSSGQRSIGNLRQGTVSGSEIWNPIGQSELTPAMIEDLRQTYYEFLAKKNKDGTLKMTPELVAKVDQAVRRARKIPSSEHMGRYGPAAVAHIMAAKLLGIEQTSSMQAGVWARIKALKDEVLKQKAGLGLKTLAIEMDGFIKEIQEKGYIDVSDDAVFKRVEAMKEVWALTTWDTTILDYAEGTPLLRRGMEGQVQNPSPTLKSVVPVDFFADERFVSNGINGWTPGQSIQLVQRYDGTVEVWADRSVESTEGSLRGLYPVPSITNGQYTRFLPRHPQLTEHVSDKTTSLSKRLDSSGRSLDAEVRTSPMPGLPPVAQRKGNWLVVEYASSEAAERARSQAKTVTTLESTVEQVQMERQGNGIRPLTKADLSEIWRQEDTTLDDHAWVSISAENPNATPRSGVLNREDMHLLRADLEAAVRAANPGMTKKQSAKHVIRQSGLYGTPEQSFFVAGLPYADAVRLGAKYGQESVATRDGMIWTTGENAGKYNPTTGAVLTGPGGTFPDFRSTMTMPGGQKVEYQAQYDFATLEDMPGNPESLGDRAPAPESRSQLVISLGGLETNLPWSTTDKIIKAARTKEAVSAALYTSDGSKVPPKWTAAFETHYIDAGGINSTYRSGADHGQTSPNQYNLWVPDSEARLLTSQPSDLAKQVRTPEEAQAVTEWADGGDMANVAGEMTIVYGDGSTTITVPRGQVFRAWKVGNAEMATTVWIGEGHPVLVKQSLAESGFHEDTSKGTTTVKPAGRGSYIVRAYDLEDATATVDILRAAGVEGNIFTQVAPPGVPWADHKFESEVAYRRQGSVSAPASAMRTARQEAATARFKDEFDIEPPFGFGDMMSDRSVTQSVETLVTLMGGNPGSAATRHIKSMVSDYRPMPESMIGSTDQTPSFQNPFGGGLRTGTHPDFADRARRVMAFTPNLRAGDRFEIGVWITELFAALEASYPDIEYRVSQDRRRFPSLPHERGALMESTVVHEMGHMVQNWFKAHGYEAIFEDRLDAFYDEVGGSAGASRLVSDYAMDRVETFPEVMTRILHQHTSPAAKVDPALDSFYRDTVNAMWAIEEYIATREWGQLGDLDLANKVRPTLFAGVRGADLTITNVKPGSVSYWAKEE